MPILSHEQCLLATVDLNPCNECLNNVIAWSSAMEIEFVCTKGCPKSGFKVLHSQWFKYIGSGDKNIFEQMAAAWNLNNRIKDIRILNPGNHA